MNWDVTSSFSKRRPFFFSNCLNMISEFSWKHTCLFYLIISKPILVCCYPNYTISLSINWSNGSACNSMTIFWSEFKRLEFSLLQSLGAKPDGENVDESSSWSRSSSSCYELIYPDFSELDIIIWDIAYVISWVYLASFEWLPAE